MPEARIEITIDGRAHAVVIDKPHFAIGRRDDNDLQLMDDNVSRAHAVILQDAKQGFAIRDTGSRHGTYVNDRRIEELHPLSDGDLVRFGRQGAPELVFRLNEREPEDFTTVTAIRLAPVANELRQVTLLLEGLRALGSGRVLEEVLAIVLDSAIDLVGADRGFIMLADETGTLQLRLARGRDGKQLSSASLATSKQIPERVFTTGCVEIKQDLTAPIVRDQHLQTISSGIRAAICVPLKVARQTEGKQTNPRERQIIGVLYLDSWRRADVSSTARRAALELLSDEAAVAIENARLYRDSVAKSRLEQDLQRAVEMQLSLLPARRYRQREIEVAGDAMPCRSVGGDFFDYFSTDNDLFVFAVADVSGKGLPASLLAAKTQGIFTAWADRTTSPGQLMQQVNRTLGRREMSASFVTMACAVLDLKTGKLCTCNAGHNPPVLLHSSGQIDQLAAGGLMLGPFGDADYDEQEVVLHPGDTVVIYSDGVTESANINREMFGIARVMTCLKDSRGASADQILENVIGAVTRFAGEATQSDDITVLVVRYLGQSANTQREFAV